ncbi:MAG: hypothetical protein IPP82_10770 [Xanthomonadales bacterium]|nr:hypothetical protein [Xanthomonadales bacterium]
MAMTTRSADVTAPPEFLMLTTKSVLLSVVKALPDASMLIAILAGSADTCDCA